MNINIKPLNKIIATDGIHAVGFEMYDPKAVEKLEADFKEAIEALVAIKVNLNSIDDAETNLQAIAYILSSAKLAKDQIEKATGQKWEDKE